MNHTPTIAVHAGIAELFEQMNELPEGQFLILQPSDFGYEDHGPEWNRRISDLSVDADQIRADAAEGRTSLFVVWYNPDGTLVPRELRDADWMKAEFHTIPRPLRCRRNAAYRTDGGYLYVSLGLWWPVAETTIDGEEACTFITDEEMFCRWVAKKNAVNAEYLERHAAKIRARRPAWATKVAVHGAESDEPEICYTATFGSAHVLLIEDGESTDVPTITIETEGPEELTAETARQLAADLAAAADAIEGKA
ncbi:hypothetical protein [Microbacterium laevaniformans]|uniref:hypothetical protein n=1 Tax=Microbacterium laevaniformans TaxID=36807 RepID=UPI00362E3C69